MMCRFLSMEINLVEIYKEWLYAIQNMNIHYGCNMEAAKRILIFTTIC